MKYKIISIILSIVLVIIIPVFIYIYYQLTLEESSYITGDLDFRGTVLLDTTEYTDVLTQYSLSNSDIEIVNHSKNPSNITIDIYDKFGKSLPEPIKEIEPGKSAYYKIDKALAPYIIKCKAVTEKGAYFISAYEIYGK